MARSLVIGIHVVHGFFAGSLLYQTLVPADVAFATRATIVAGIAVAAVVAAWLQLSGCGLPGCGKGTPSPKAPTRIERPSELAVAPRSVHASAGDRHDRNCFRHNMRCCRERLDFFAGLSVPRAASTARR